MYYGNTTKSGEMRRTAEVCREIIEREGNTRRGIYFVIAFLHDQGRDLSEIMAVLESDGLGK